MMSLIFAGEAVFLPAFHLGRYFKTPLLVTFDIDILQLGQLGAIYGIAATACYFLGGPLADRWSPKKMLSASLVVTALGSLYMATVPSFIGLCALFGFWGVTTIFAFWAPLIRATREWASDDGQASAFGILDGGRGLASAVIALIAAYAFAAMVGNSANDLSTEFAAVAETANIVQKLDSSAEADAAERVQAAENLDQAKQELAATVKKIAPEVKKLVYAYGVICLLAAACVWLFVPDNRPVVAVDDGAAPEEKEGSLHRLLRVLMSPAIWLQAVVIIAAYSAFKMIDNYGIYSEDAYGLTTTQSAKLISYISFIRVGAALGAGWIADRYLGTRLTIQVCFAVLIASYLTFLFVPPSPALVWLMVANMAVSCLGFFALRGIYFALLEESGTPRELTGTAVGVISFVGFAPEIFMGPLTGWLIRDARANGDVLAGYHQIFWILLVLAGCGVLAALTLRLFSAGRSERVRPQGDQGDSAA
jgi:sugar phosphate permease